MGIFFLTKGVVPIVPQNKVLVGYISGSQRLDFGGLKEEGKTLTEMLLGTKYKQNKQVLLHLKNLCDQETM